MATKDVIWGKINEVWAQCCAPFEAARRIDGKFFRREGASEDVPAECRPSGLLEVVMPMVFLM